MICRNVGITPCEGTEGQLTISHLQIRQHCRMKGKGQGTRDKCLQPPVMARTAGPSLFTSTWAGKKQGRGFHHQLHPMRPNTGTSGLTTFTPPC